MADKEIFFIRHSNTLFPQDKLSPEGILKAESLKGMIEFAPVVVASDLNRAQLTATLMGRSDFNIDPRAEEIVIDEINAPSAHEYVQRVLNERPFERKRAAENLSNIALELPDRSVVVSHNAAISALLFELTGHKTSIENLEGIAVGVDDDRNISFNGWVE